MTGTARIGLLETWSVGQRRRLAQAFHERVWTTSSTDEPRPWHTAVVLALLALLVIEWVRTAWVSDDAIITLRSVLNLLHGGGPNFNWGEHVDAFTDPAWFLLISAFSLSGLNVFWITLALSLVLSVGTFVVIWRFCSSSLPHAAVGLGALLLSKSFVDFSSSGLENPLGAFLLVVIVAAALRAQKVGWERASTVLALSTGLLYLTRVDLLLLVLPLVLTVLFRGRSDVRRTLVRVVTGIALPVAWTVFSLLYYGTPVPNTAYAKLGTGIDRKSLILQGTRYFFDSIGRDPITLALIAVGIVAMLLAGRAVQKALACGIVVYLLYVAWIGGDFMSGRFYMVPAVAAAAGLASLRVPVARLLPVGGLLGLLGLLGISATLLSGPTYEDRAIAQNGIADERGYWFQTGGLVAQGATGYNYAPWAAPSAIKVRALCGGLGRYGLDAGPEMHLIDTCGLADPVLAKVPAIPNPAWRIGHFLRAVPDYYAASILDDKNEIRDPQLHRYYDAIRSVTRSTDLLAHDRLRDIWLLNTGALKPGSSYPIDPVIYG